MSAQGNVYSWCGCRDLVTGGRLGSRCPRRGKPGHGSWYLSLELPAGLDGHRRRKTVDWIVVLPEVTLLVEVKSAIPTEPVRLGTPDAVDAVLGKLGKALRQIDATVQLIEDRDPALAAVPSTLPALGLAVTLEPFHIANAGFDPLPVTRTAVTVADTAEIESLVRIADTPPGQLLLDRAADEVRRTWSLDTAFQGHARERNPVLDQAWDSYPWASAARAYRESSTEPRNAGGGHRTP